MLAITYVNLVLEAETMLLIIIRFKIVLYVKYVMPGFKCRLKVSKFQNEFMKSTFLPKYEQNIVRISDLYCATLQGRNPYNFSFIFWEKW